MRDLRSPTMLWLKGILLLVIGLTAGLLVWAEAPTVRTALLLALTCWAFCRAYYFAFYVLEHYADPGFRYAGLGSLARYLLRRRK